jgi:hypothetical protein
MEELIKNYTHDYRDMKMTEEELSKTLNSFVLEIMELIKQGKLCPFPQFSKECREYHQKSRIT